MSLKSASSTLIDLQQAIQALESQRALLGDSVVNTALKPLQEQAAQFHQAARPAVSLEGERKLVTIMFADISGFTALAETLDPEAVRELMNGCFAQLVPIVERYGGTVDKFIGDEIMALFGAPAAHENDPERALRAALDMLDTLRIFNAECGTSLGIHFGINTGLVIAGGIGTSDRQQYSVMGDAVNVAARLEDLSERGEILLGLDTYRLVAPLFEFEAREPVCVKGKTEPIPVFNLLRVKNASGSVRGIQGLSSPLIGREAEIQAFESAFNSLRVGKGSVILLSAEAGIGKSRLVAEARSNTHDLAWLEGRALCYTQSMSYWIARDMLYSLIGVRPDAPLDIVNTALRRAVETRLSDDQVTAVYPYLARILDLPLDEAMHEQIQYLKPEALRGQMLRAYHDFVRAQAPLVLVWEDLHWADPSSLLLLEALLPLVIEAPVLILLVFRPAYEGDFAAFCQKVPDLVGEEHYQSITLGPLTRSDSACLVENLLRVENIPDRTLRTILDKAEGNPFFLEELIRSLIDAELVVLQQGRAVATQAIESLEIPDTLQGVIAARIDQLPAAEKRTLQAASVIGRVFQQRVLTHILNQHTAEADLDDSLDDLQHRELIRLRTEVRLREMEYIFKHAVTQEVTYNSLLIARRRDLHRVTAETLEVLFPDQLDDFAASLAYHYERAEVDEKAIHYLIIAAERARANFANTEATNFYQSVLAVMAPYVGHEVPPGIWHQRAATIYEHLGDVLKLTGKHTEAQNSYQNALDLIHKDERIWQSRLYRGIAQTWEMQRQFDKTLKACDMAERVLGNGPVGATTEWWHEWVQIHLDRIHTYYWLGKTQEMAVLCEQIQPIVEKYGRPSQRGKFFLEMALMGVQRDRYHHITDETLEYAKVGVAAHREANNLVDLAWAQFALGFTYLWRGELEQAETELSASLALSERIGDITIKTRCLTYLTIVFRKRGKVEEVRYCAALSLEAAKTAQMLEYVGMGTANLAWVAQRDGRTTEAEALGKEALSLLEQVIQGSMFSWVAHWPLLGVYAASDQMKEAAEHGQAMLQAIGQPLPENLAAMLQTAITAWEGGDLYTAQASFKEASELARQLGYL